MKVGIEVWQALFIVSFWVLKLEFHISTHTHACARIQVIIHQYGNIINHLNPRVPPPVILETWHFVYTRYLCLSNNSFKKLPMSIAWRCVGVWRCSSIHS
jgi:hypothetical protein